MMGFGVIPQDSDLYLGMIGTHGKPFANRVMNEADVIVMCGARVGDRAVTAPNVLEAHAKIIHIDIDPAEIGKNLSVDIPIVGSIQLVLQEMAEQVSPCACEDWVQTVRQYKQDYIPRGEPRTDFVEPRQFVRDLSAMMEEDAILTADVGQNQIWAANNFNVKEGRFLTSGGMGTMGYSLPAAIGAKLAKPHRQVVAICGDGSFQMSMCELATVCQNQVGVKLIIMRNQRLGMVREFQTRLYGSRYIATILNGDPDFVQLVSAYGIQTALATSNQQAKELAKEMLASNKPYVLVCDVDPDTPSI